MKICGIVAEYNPFHRGHAWHMAETRRVLGADAVLVCAMSGNFVQRGDFAVLEKYDRAAMAVEGGADLVVELPLAAALSSAEGFAQGAVGVLSALGCGYLSFGAECAEVPLLRRAAALREVIRPGLAAALRAGLSYAAAVQKAMEPFDAQAAALLSAPNNTLAIAYCAALESTGAVPVAIPRRGAGHDSARPAEGFASASLIRRALREGQAGWEAWMPRPAAEALSAALREGRAPVALENCECAVLAHLRRMDADALRPFAPTADGLAERLCRAVRDGGTFRAVCEAAQTRRFPLSRIRRTLLRAYLDIPAGSAVAPQYLRVLAIGRRGAEVLRDAQGRLPVIVKPTAERALPAPLQPLLRRDAVADALYALALPNPARREAGARWRKTPFIGRA